MFSKFAPAYWAAGLPVIPLREKQKMPAPNAWQSFATQLPDAETQAHWLASYPEGNIGLPLGPQSGMVALDLDTDEPHILEIIKSVVTLSPWIRRGKKGAVYMYADSGERTTRIKGEDGKTIVEILCKGTQVVLPPSIHPDTQMPYTANCDLLSLVGKLPPLPRDFEGLLRRALIAGGVKLSSRGSVAVTKWVPSGGRDSAMTAMAGLMARGVLKGERTLDQAKGEIEAWVVNFTENVVGDPMDPAKAVTKLMEFLRRDIVEMGKTLPEGWDFGLSDGDIMAARAFFGEHLEEWPLEKYMDYLEAQFKEVPRENVTSRASIVDEVLVRLAKDQHINSMQLNMILNFIYAANSRVLSIGALRSRLKELRGVEITGNDHTEIATHLIKELECYGEIRCEGVVVYQWAGSHWREISPAHILRVLCENFGGLPAARKSSDHKGILATLLNLIPHGLKSGEAVKGGINFANGFLNLDMELVEHDPRFGCRYVLPYRYAPNEGAPLRFLGLLDQIWGEEPDYADRVQALREAMAATMFGMGPTYTRAICLYGPPKTGKSTIKNIMEMMIPEEVVCSVPPHDWADKFLPTMMLGKLVNFCGELSEKEMIAGDRFKSIVEGGELQGQFKGGQIFKFKPFCTHWFASNHLPRTRDTSDGFNRRWLFLHCAKPVRVGEVIKGLDEQIVAEEQEAIAAWVAPAILDLQMNADYTIPACHKYIISDVASQNNSVRHFLTAGGIMVHPSVPGKASNRISETELYMAYYGFCKVIANVPPVALKRFRTAMSEIGVDLGFELKLEHSAMGESATYLNLTIVK